MNVSRSYSKNRSRWLLSALWISSFFQIPVATQSLDRTPPIIPRISPEVTRSGSENEQTKLSPELVALVDQYEDTTRGEPDDRSLSSFSTSQLSLIFGIGTGDSNPPVILAVRFNRQIDEKVLLDSRASIIARSGKVAYVSVPVGSVRRLATSTEIAKLNVMKSLHAPDAMLSLNELDTRPLERSSSIPTGLANEFDKQTFSGKGVAVGVIDTGIDWRHEDFRKSDGSTRILAIWDLFDDSYQSSGGSVGSKPPVYIESSRKWLGTVYTQDQINAALRGSGKVNSRDRHGHGTAVAGTAASNGRATSHGVPVGQYSGVATEADLIVVKASDCGSFLPAATITSEWIISIAKSLGKPVVVNMSYGGHFSNHDGTDEDEELIDSLVGPRKAGTVITVAAGNEGRYSFRAGGRFGPRRAGQADQFSSGIEMGAKSLTRLLTLFNASDDWGLAFRGTNSAFLGADGKQSAVFLTKNGSTVDCRSQTALKNQIEFDQFCASVRPSFGDGLSKSDTLQFQVPPGDYMIWGFGNGPRVPNGQFDMYLVESPQASKAAFTTGGLKTEVVGTPAGSRNAIAVGSYDFRGSWVNKLGEETYYNLTPGAASAYSNSGFRRDGVVKPDITAPARFTISSLSLDAQPTLGGCSNSLASSEDTHHTLDGFHIAWEGTSAASPFVAGVVALMLQKNPGMDSEQVKTILKKTARSGSKIGAVPNPQWGWGMIDPAAALRNTPAARLQGKRGRRTD